MTLVSIQTDKKHEVIFATDSDYSLENRKFVIPITVPYYYSLYILIMMFGYICYFE